MLFNPSLHRMAVNAFMDFINLKGICSEGMT